MFIKTLSVSQVNEYIKKMLSKDFILNNLTVKGEISNFKIHSSGNIFFSIKDDASKLNCVMFSSDAYSLDFMIRDGMSVEIKGSVRIYVKDGSYQLYCKEIKKAGEGQLFEEFTKLKKKLESQGLFDEDHKRPIPKISMNIGVITSPTGAAVRDIIKVSKRRNKNVMIKIFPSLVQGKEASYNIVKGIDYFNSTNDVDVILIARGGGSIEELWAFNEEIVAKGIFNSNIPVVCGIGHETDFTIADFVCDKSASTPSAAAEICVANIDDINNNINYVKNKIRKDIISIIDNRKSELDMMSKVVKYNNPYNTIALRKQKISDLKDSLTKEMNIKLSRSMDELKHINTLIQSYNPYSILSRGYSIVEDDNKKVLNKVEDFSGEKSVTFILSDGNVTKKITD